MKSSSSFILVILLLHIASTSAFVKYSKLYGGSGDADLTDPGVLEADAFVRAHYKDCDIKPVVNHVGKLLRARSQIVAGINYTLYYSQNHTGIFLIVTVFKSLPNSQGVSEYSISNCDRRK